MTDDGLDRGGSYQRRLARAAAASLAIHMIFFGGLSVSRLDLANERPTDPEAKEAVTKKRASDFRLHVNRAATSERPAHERPLSMSVPMEAARPAEARDRPVERSVADRREAVPEMAQTVPPRQPEFERSRADEAMPTVKPSESPARVAEVKPTESQPTADMAAAIAATESSAAPMAAPAPATARDRGEAAPTAARWRPKEVALLERLTASAPEASALAARAVPAAPLPPAATPIARRSATAASNPSAVRAQATAPATTQTARSAPAATPAAREPARRTSSATSSTTRPVLPTSDSAAPSPSTLASSSATVARSPTAAGSVAGSAHGSRSPARAATVTAGQAATGAAAVATGSGTGAASSISGGSGQITPSPAASGGGRPGSRGPRASALGGASQASGSGTPGRADTDGGPATGTSSGRVGTAGDIADLGGGLAGGRDALGGTSSTGGGGSRSPGRDAGGVTVGTTGSGSVASIEPAGLGGQGTGGGPGSDTSGRGPGGEGQSLMPAARARGGPREGRSALGSRGSGRGGIGDESDGEGEGLSVTASDVAALVAEGRRGGDGLAQPQGPRSLERVTAAALPTDGRVRDIAEAFSRRRGGGDDMPGGISDRETLDRARAMTDRGLDFLVRSQRHDGRWRLTEYAGASPADIPKLDSDTAATGLALLCFLGAGHDHFSGPHRDTVRRGLEFLVSVQRHDGDLYLPADDLSNSCSQLYSHGIASIAICEAVGMTGDARLKAPARDACRFIAESRHPTLGGWRYLPRSDADLSVSGWMLVALRAGDLAGVGTDPAALDGVRTLLAASISPTDPARYAYNPGKPDQRRTDLSVACMTAVGGLMRLHTGAASDDPGVVASAHMLAAMPPSYGSRNQKARDAYLWYYASQVLVHTGGEEWQAWYATLVDTLEAPQQRDGERAGSWDPLGDLPDRWGEYGGRVYVTTLHLLALEVPWRHLPTYATAPAR